jgi:hypothetical protein
VARGSKRDDPDKLLQFVEEFALLCEQSGWPRIAGKILAWLLVCEAPQQDAEQLAAALQASKASISTMTRYLEDRGFIERTSLPGDRRVHYRIRAGVWSHLLRERLKSVGAMRALADRAAALVQHRPPAQRARADDMAAFYAWWERELPALFDRWEQVLAERGRKR